MSFDKYMYTKSQTAEARAKHDYTGVLLEKRIMEERMAEMISQYEPVASIDIDREKLKQVFKYIMTGRAE